MGYLKNLAILLSVMALTAVLTYEYAFVKAYAIALEIVDKPLTECVNVIYKTNNTCELRHERKK